jgi:integrase
MATDKTTVRFWLRKDRPNKDGSSPIHLIYQIQGQRKYYAIPGLKLYPINWDPINQVAIYLDRKAAKKIDSTFDASKLLTSAEALEINLKLQEALGDIRDIEKRFRLDKITFTPSMVIKALQEFNQPETRIDEPGRNLVDFIREFVKDSAGTHRPGTLKVYTGLANHLEAFELTRKKEKITFEALDLPLLRKINSYLADEAGMNNVTAAKQMSTLKTLLNYARTIYKINVRPDYRDFKVSRKDSDFEVITLNEDEFLSIYNLDLSKNSRLDQVRDVFCFSCATGLRYSDLKQLKKEHIRKDNTIRITAEKTGQKLVIPLNPISYSILQKYKDRHYPLPVISNQKTNDYIKEIGKMAEVDTPIEKIRTHGVRRSTKVFKKHELLSVHVGRKSFITLSLEKGIAIQEVMGLSGHTTFKAFKRYVDVSDSRKKAVMAKAWGEVNPLKKAN